MTGDIREKLLAAFQVEHREYLEDIAARLDRLAQGKAQPGDIEEMLRQAHSLKGAARAVDLPQIEALSHRLEAVFVRLRDGSLTAGAAMADRLRHVLDSVEDLAVAAAGNSRPVDTGPVLADLDALLGTGAAAVPEPTPPAPPEPESPPRPAPAIDALDTVRIAAGRLDRVIEAAGELVAEQHRQEAAMRGLRGFEGQLADLNRSWETLRRAAASVLPGAFAAAADPESGQAGLSRLFDEVDQQLRRLGRSGRSVRRLQEQANRAAYNAGEMLNQELRGTRMIPVGSVFGATRKIVRDLASDTGRAVEIEIRGLDTEADRLVLQALKDPVLHLLRNAVGHGIEPEAERIAAGKPPPGRIALDFTVAGGRLVVTVEDDGRGFDRAAILATARRHGILPADAPAPRGGALLQAIFAPGFSTSAAVTALSGRGMGLSVVRETVSRLNGTAEAVERPGGGARFRLSVPVFATSRTLLLVQVGERVFALPSDGIDRLLRVEVGRLAPVEGRPTLMLEGRPVPVVPLARLIGLDSTEVAASHARIPIVVLGEDRPELSIAVDELLGLRNALVKDLGLPPIPGSPASGGIILDDGSVAVVLSPHELGAAARQLGTAPAIEIVERAPARRTPRVLVVDDSLTTRTLEKSILEAHGFEVLLAVDGIEGLNRVRSERPELVIADVQMPRLDGFGLVQAIKADPALQQTPVILVTSLDRREDRARGLALGADAYVVKQKFDQQELLETIRQLL